MSLRLVDADITDGGFQSMDGAPRRVMEHTVQVPASFPAVLLDGLRASDRLPGCALLLTIISRMVPEEMSSEQGRRTVGLLLRIAAGQLDDGPTDMGQFRAHELLDKAIIYLEAMGAETGVHGERLHDAVRKLHDYQSGAEMLEELRPVLEALD